VVDIVDMAHAAMAGLMEGGVAPVIKHIPGHGRATVDSHKALPKIKANRQTLENSDFLPFRKLSDAHSRYDFPQISDRVNPSSDWL